MSSIYVTLTGSDNIYANTGILNPVQETLDQEILLSGITNITLARNPTISSQSFLEPTSIENLSILESLLIDFGDQLVAPSTINNSATIPALSVSFDWDFVGVEFSIDFGETLFLGWRAGRAAYAIIGSQDISIG